MKSKNSKDADKVASTGEASRSSRPKRPPLRIQRMRAALTAKDPELAEILEEAFCAYHLRRHLYQAEASLKTSRNADYARLTPLRATDLFAEAYLKIWTWRVRHYGFTSSCDLTGELIDTSTAVLEDLWKARQQADAIGMDYYMYLNAVIEKHIELYRCPPNPRDLHGAGALIAALAVLNAVPGEAA